MIVPYTEYLVLNNENSWSDQINTPTFFVAHKAPQLGAWCAEQRAAETVRVLQWALPPAPSTSCSRRGGSTVTTNRNFSTAILAEMSSRTLIMTERKRTAAGIKYAAVSTNLRQALNSYTYSIQPAAKKFCVMKGRLRLIVNKKGNWV